MGHSRDWENPIRTKGKPGFLDLPADVRIIIYRILLVQPEPFNPLNRRCIKRYFATKLDRKALLRAGVRLLQSCKEVSDEASTILYGENSIYLRPDTIDGIPRYLGSIGRSNCSKVSSLSVNFEYSQERRWRNWWNQQVEADFSVTKREVVFGLVEANRFLPEYPVAGQVSFANLNTIKDMIPHDKLEKFGWDWDGESMLEDMDALRSESLCDGYPLWRDRQSYAGYDSAIHPSSVLEALDFITKCCSLRRLELWFPDPQRFAMGYGLLREDRMFLRLLWPLKGLVELVIHGIDELGMIESVVETMDIPRVVAELNCNRARPFLHVEAGRPNLRANASWSCRVPRNDRYTMTFELQRARPVYKDMFSNLPAEVRALIYDSLFPCWYDSFHAAGHYDCGHIQYPYIILQDSAFSCRPKKDPGKYLTGAAALLRVSKKLHNDAAEIIYSQYTFTTTPPFGYHYACCAQMDTGESFHPDIGLLHHFLSHIGTNNRKRLRHLYMGLHSFIPFQVSTIKVHSPALGGEQPVGHDLTSCTRLCTKNFWWQLSRLLIMMQEIPALDSIVLRFSDNLDSYSMDPRYFPELEEEDDYIRAEACGRYMPNANYYLNLFSNLSNVGHVETAGCLGMTDSELFARLVGAKSIAIHRKEEKSRMIHARQALDYRIDDKVVEAQAKAWGWTDGVDSQHGCFVKKLTPDNMTPAVARRLWAARSMEEDMALMAELSDELDVRRQ